jgi:ribosomal protein S18 acetylase RimI-like enzyme
VCDSLHANRQSDVPAGTLWAEGPRPTGYREPMRVRPRVDADRPVMEAFLARWHSSRVARLGALVRPLDHPALVAEADGRLIGLLTYVVDGPRCEVLTLHTDEPRRGVGSALIEAVSRIAADAGCTTLWLITTNDNVDALRFYQRRGFRLAALHPGAVDGSRARLKPEIPEIGDHGIPLRDELVLELDLSSHLSGSV